MPGERTVTFGDRCKYEVTAGNKYRKIEEIIWSFYVEEDDANAIMIAIYISTLGRNYKKALHHFDW